jgi:hypothetical protein
MNPADLTSLTRRWLDDCASPEEQEALMSLLLQSPEAAKDFANCVRFESILAQHCTAREKALLEFAALDCEMPAMQPQKVTWRTGVLQSPLARLAAVLVLGGVLFLWMQKQPSGPVLAQNDPQTPSRASPTQNHVILQPRPKTALTFPVAATAANTVIEPLAVRLDDFYLPAISLEGVTFDEAARWLIEQLRAHNYAKRADLDQLTLTVPGAASKRRITVHSGPISFLKALSLISSLAHCESKLENGRLTLADLGVQSPQTRPATSQLRQDALALGLRPSSNPAQILATSSEHQALETLAASREQLTSLAPLQFVPLVVPSIEVGQERVLTPAEAQALWSKYAGQLPATLPIISLPFAPSTSIASTGATVIKVEPVGEMNRVIIEQPVTTPPASTAPGGLNQTDSAPIVAATNGTTVISDSNGVLSTTTISSSTDSTTSTSSALALLAAAHGLIIVLDDSGNSLLMTPDGIPVNAADLTPLAAAAPPEPASTSLVLIPVGN